MPTPNTLFTIDSAALSTAKSLDLQGASRYAAQFLDDNRCLLQALPFVHSVGSQCVLSRLEGFILAAGWSNLSHQIKVISLHIYHSLISEYRDSTSALTEPAQSEATFDTKGLYYIYNEIIRETLEKYELSLEEFSTFFGFIMAAKRPISIAVIDVLAGHLARHDTSQGGFHSDSFFLAFRFLFDGDSESEFPPEKDQPLRILFPTFYNFLTGIPPTHRFHIDTWKFQDIFAFACFNQIDRDIFATKNGSTLLDLSNDHSGLFQYAIRFGIDHLDEDPVEGAEVALVEVVVKFVKSHLNAWIRLSAPLGHSEQLDKLKRLDVWLTVSEIQ